MERPLKFAVFVPSARVRVPGPAEFITDI